MNNNDFIFDLDLVPKGTRPVVYAKQGDIGRKYTARLFWNGASWTATGTTARIRGRKSDDTVFDYSATVSGNTAYWSTSEQMTIAAGNVDCELVFTQSGVTVGTATFVMIVRESPYDPNALSESVVTGVEDVVAEQLPDAVADWIDDNATTSAEFQTVVGNAVEDYIDDNGVPIRQSAITPSLDQYAGAELFDYYCKMEKGTIGATVTDGTRWKTAGAVRIECLDNLVFTLNEGYKAMIYMYADGFASISGRPTDPDGNGWLIHSGTRRVSEMNGISNDHRTQAIAVNIVIAAANGTDVLTEQQVNAAFKLQTIKTTPMIKASSAVIAGTGKWYFAVPVSATAKRPFSVFIKSDSSTPMPHTQLRFGSTSYSVDSKTFDGVDLSNGYLLTFYPETLRDDSKQVLMWCDDTAGDIVTGAEVSLYVEDASNRQLQDAEYSVAVKDTFVVAASNTPARYARSVDFFCDGINDEEEIQAAVDAVRASAMKSGTVQLLSGDYSISHFAEYDSTIADRPTAILAQAGAYCVNIEGSVGENGTKLHIVTDELGELGEQVDVFALGVQGLQGTIVNYKNLRVIVDDQDHPLIVFNNYYNAACKMESVRMYALGYGAGKMPVEGLIGVRCSRGSDNGIGQEMRHVGATGFYEGFQIGSEHLVAFDLLGRSCYYAYTFGNYDYNAGMCEHPLVLINCADEGSARLPLFARNGKYNTPNTNNGLQEVHLIGFNLEVRPNWNPTLAEPVPATETRPDTWCGHIDFVASREGTGNIKNFKFWADGSGQRFDTVNGTHRKGGTTAERNSYTPQYMQQYFDTTLNKMLVYDGSAWRDMNGAAV